MADEGGITGGELPGTELLAKVLDPATYKGVSPEEAQKALNAAKAGLGKESRRTVEKIEKRGRRG